jgi:hypothetical protein
MPELHRNLLAHADHAWAPTADEMELMFRALDPDATHQLHGPQPREYAICIACAHGSHESPGTHEGCDCACHAKPAPPRKQTDLREFYRDPSAFGLRLSLGDAMGGRA